MSGSRATIAGAAADCGAAATRGSDFCGWGAIAAAASSAICSFSIRRIDSSRICICRAIASGPGEGCSARNLASIAWRALAYTKARFGAVFCGRFATVLVRIE